MIIKEQKLQTFDVDGAPYSLYSHQKRIFDEWVNKDSFVLISGTGSGKTLSASFPIISNQENAFFVYPTNALIEDQKKSILNVLENMNKSYFVIDETNLLNSTIPKVDYNIIKINGNILGKIKAKYNFKTKGDAIKFLLSHNPNNTIVLTNPDILFLILSLRYRKSADIISILESFNSIVFDEFHIYWGIELVNTMSSLFILNKLELFKKKIFLTATPSENVLEILDRLFSPLVIELDKTNQGRIVTHKIELTGLQICREDKIPSIIKFLKSKSSDLRLMRKSNNSASYTPLVIILNSVVEAIVLEKKILKIGFETNEIASIRGLMANDARKTTSQTVIVIGTSAIEIGIDFSCDYLIFEAMDSASFLQRFGRIGRHSVGKAILLGDKYEAQAMNEQIEYERDSFCNFINSVYKTKNSFSWFLQTKNGLLVAFLHFNAFLKSMKKDRNLKHKEKKEIEKLIIHWFQEFTNVILNDNETAENELSHTIVQKHKMKKTYNWIEVLDNYHSFRNSFNSEKVNVKSESILNRSSLIKADIVSILRYGKNLKWDKYKKQLEVDSFTERNKIRFSASLGISENYGEIQVCQKDNPFKLMLNDHNSPLSEIRENHIYCYFPKEFLNSIGYDWRLQSIFCNDNNSIIIFGKNALIAYELYKKNPVFYSYSDNNDFEGQLL